MAHTYDIKGENNKIILVDNNTCQERLLVGTIPGLIIIIHGNNNVVHVAKNTIFNNSEISISNDNCEIELLCKFCKIGVSCDNGDGQILKIGKNSSLGGVYFHMQQNSKIIIGENCLFSDEIHFWSNDGHTLLDDKGNVLNDTQPIIVGNHCWVGYQVKLLKGSELADNCVVGFGSILTKKILTKNCVVAGIPARVVKENINWDDLPPAVYKKKNGGEVILVFPCSDFYVPYFAVALQSLIEHSDNKRGYKVFVMESDISKTNKNRIQSVVKNSPNISLEFYNMNKIIKNIELAVWGHISKETYFKLCIPKIFREYSRVLFCDSDIVFMNDPAKLFDMDIGDKKIAAAECHLLNGIINTNPEDKKYIIKTLGIKNADKYLQAGVVLFNNKLISDTDVDNLINMANGKKYHFLDQDILNVYFQNDWFEFSSEWNYETPQQVFSETNKNMSKKHKEQYIDAGKRPKIIHYSGSLKPWICVNEAYADIWWNYARHSLFYETILNRRKECIVKVIHASHKLFLCKIYKLILRIVKHFFNKKSTVRKKLRVKYDNCVQLINDAQKYKKHH